MRFRAKVKYPYRAFEELPIRQFVGVAINEARVAVVNGARVALVLRDSEGEDHPDNAGKFFLHQIIK